jgi:signal transduction histidine kinase
LGLRPREESKRSTIQKNKELEQFAINIIAHDLKTPLNNIKSL